MQSVLHRTRAGALLAALLAAVVVGVALLPSWADGASTGDLQQQIDSARNRESSLSGAAARLGALEAKAQAAVDALQGRLAARQAEVDAWEARLARTEDEFTAARRRADRLQRRLVAGQAVLADVLRAKYMADKPDLIGVVLSSKGFNQLLERVAFLKRIQARNTQILDNVRRARADAARERARLAAIVPRQRAATAAVQRERDALAAIGAVLQSKRDTIAAARSARLAALQATTAGRRRAQRELTKLQNEQARASVSLAGPGGPWAIPWAIVQCESGGRNLPPNSATASGYYQFIDSTWKAMGGSTAHAYQASKAEQDRLAARLWNGGAGKGNWDCTAIVGL